MGRESKRIGETQKGSQENGARLEWDERKGELGRDKEEAKRIR